METLNAYPLYFHSTLSESEIEKCECSDGIYVSPELFRTFQSDSDEIVILKLSKNTMDIYVTISGTHNEDDMSVLLPSWICQCLGLDCGDPVLITTYTDSRIGLKIQIKPHTTDYVNCADPVGALRDGFEHYTILCKNMVIPLYVNGSKLIVSVLDTYNTQPICIRGSELTVEIIELTSASTAPIAATANSITEEIDFDAGILPTVNQSCFPGAGKQTYFPGAGNTLGRH